MLQDQEGVGGETASDPLASRRPLARLPPLGGGGGACHRRSPPGPGRGIVMEGEGGGGQR